MKETLAKRLVADLMDWKLERATSEFAWLDLMVNYKFDSYQQYGPGHRFMSICYGGYRSTKWRIASAFGSFFASIWSTSVKTKCITSLASQVR